MPFHKSIEKHWAKRSLPSFLLLPFAFLFGFILIIRRFFYKRKIFNQYKSRSKIVSIGNLTVGGSGKTPFAIFLAKYLKSKGYSVAVSHRGYKGRFEKSIKLISDENSIFDCANDAGDEPYLIAKNLQGIPVIVGKNRNMAIKYLEDNFLPDFIILDDSFQHLKVKHDLDFLLFNAINPVGNGFMIPAGKLREPISAAKFGDIIIFNNCQQEFNIPEWARKFKKTIFKIEYIINNFVKYCDNEINEVNFFREKEIFLLSGIGNPKSFEDSIKNSGINFLHHFAFPDHHNFKFEKDIQPIINKSIKNNIDAILTTEKDYVKLQNLSLFKIDFYYAKLNIKIDNFKEFEEIMSRIHPAQV